jgi:hypothetical protein
VKAVLHTPLQCQVPYQTEVLSDHVSSTVNSNIFSF